MARASQPLPYTASPYRLALYDLYLWVRITFVWPPWAGIPSIILPIWPFRSGPLDELYPTPANLYSISIQLIFTLVQAFFLVSIPISAVVGIGFPLLPPVLGAYVPVWLTWIIAFILINRGLSIVLLNGLQHEFYSQAPLSVADMEAHTDEKWVFVNGVAAGAHWMQSNLDRLSLGFRREIYGIHNPTRGIVFDLIECILERTFSYPTPSTRMVYSRLLDIVSNDQYQKIILILHSQGAIEGGLALDWLFATVPGHQLSRIEVYTFGSAANHFNDPVATTIDSNGKRVDLDSTDSTQSGRTLKCIEHYANSGDYVAKFGILNFRPLPPGMMRMLGRRWISMFDPDTDQEVENRYAGRLFIRKGTGHQMNGNYLDSFFPMDASLTRTLDNNPFMDGTVNTTLLNDNDIVVVRDDKTHASGNESHMGMAQKTITPLADTKVQFKIRAKYASRLFMYRNGLSPEDTYKNETSSED